MTAELAEDVAIGGVCDDAFAGVRETLGANFTERDEVGAAVCIYKDGVKVVDLWAGHRDGARSRAWTEDTLSVMYSISKSMCVLCVHILADRGLVDIEAPVATYWPEFAQAGKEAVLVRHMLSHHCGVCWNEHAAPGDIFDYAAMVVAIEKQELAWPPGTRGAYNTVNIGYALGEIVRRVSGQPINEFLRDNVTGPLGADVFFGMDEAQLARVADIQANPDNGLAKARVEPGSALAKAWKAMPKPYSVDIVNSRDMRTVVMPSFGGHAAARGLARIYAALANGGELDGVRLLSRAAIDRARTEQWDEIDGTFGRAFRLGMGFFLNKAETTPMGSNPRAFGHPGSGGTFAFADPERNFAIAVMTNFQSEGASIGRRSQALVEAAVAVLD